MSYSLALASLALAALGIELRRMIQRDNGGVDFGIAAARAIFGLVVFGLFRLARLGDVSEALVSLPFFLFAAHTFPEGFRTHPSVVRAATLAWFACGLVLVAVDFTVNRCVGQTHSILDRLLTRDGVNEELAEEYVKWRKDYDRQLQYLAALAGDLSSTSKEFNARRPLFRGGSEAEPRRPNCTFSTSQEVKMEEFSIFHRLYHRNDRVGEWYKARLFSVRSIVLANKQRIHELNTAIVTESEALAELKVEMEFEAQEQRRLRAPFWRDGSRLAFQARKASEAGSLAVVHVGSGLPPRRAFSGVQREAPLPRPRPVVMPENNLPLHAQAREEPHRHREFAPRPLAVARIDELYSRPPPVQYEQDPQEISAIIHRDPRMQIMPSWQPVQVVDEDLDVEMTDAPALLEFEMSGALGDACSAAHGSMELCQPAQVVGLQHTNFPVPTPLPVFNTAPAQPSPLRLPPVVAPTSSSTATWATASVAVAASCGAASAGTTTNKPTTASIPSGGPPDLAKLAQAAVPAPAATSAPVNKPAPVPPQPAQASPAPAAPQTIGAAGRRPPQLLVISNWASAPVGSTSSSFDTPEVQPLPEPAADDHVDGPAKKKSMASGSAAAAGPSGPVNRPRPSASRAAASAASRRRAPMMTGSNVVRTNTASASDGAAASSTAAAASTPFTFTQATFAPSSQPPGT